MYTYLANTLRRYFSDPDAIILTLTIVIALLAIMLLGNILAPVIASIIIAYLLDGLATKLERIKVPHLLSAIITFVLFLALVLVALFWLLPILSQQTTNLINEFPVLLNRGQALLMQLPQKYPDIVSTAQVQSILTEINAELGRSGKWVLSYSLSMIPGIIEFVVYFVLVPLLVFFFLKDKKTLIEWSLGFLPNRRHVIREIWGEINAQIGNYVRGRVLEIIIVGGVSSLVFGFMGLDYGLLLGVLVGLSVIVPYIGAIVVTIPVLLIAFLEWGFGGQFITLAIAYAVIVALDANVLVPLMFAEAMNIHAVAIIVSVLFFGGIWGFWGVFFAIPLASAVNAVIKAWPVRDGAQ